MKTILLSGSTGFLGSHLLRKLLEKKYKVVILKRSFSKTLRIKKYLKHVTTYNIDNLSLEKIFIENKIDIVLHLACNYGKNDQDDSDLIETNMLFGIKILKYAECYGAKLFINLDTLLPKNLGKYALSKSFFRDWLYQYSGELKIVNLRVEYIYGPNDSLEKLIPFVIKNINDREPTINLTSGKQKRDFIYVDDVIDAVCFILFKFENFEIFNEFEIGTGKSTSIRKMLKMLVNEFEKRFGVTNTSLNFGKVPGRKNEPMEIQACTQKINDLGWKPQIELADGLGKVFDYEEK